MTDLIESEDELLDPQPGPVAVGAPRRRWAAALHRLRERTPLGAPDGGADPVRRRRRTLTGLLAAGVAAGAAATGVAMHSHDVTHALARTQNRTLLHLLGGTATLTFTPTDGGVNGFGLPGNFQAPLTTDFTIALRNDGAQPLEVTAVSIAVPGLDVVSSPPATTFAPGDAEALTSRVAVHCMAADLPRYPSGVTVSVRTPAARGKAAGPVTEVPLAFDAGHPAAPPAGAGSQNSDIFLAAGTDALGVSPATSSLYQLCGAVLAMAPPRVSATAVLAAPGQAPSPRNPVVRYTLHIDGSPDHPEVALPVSKPTAVPGVSAQTDLAGPRQIGSDGLDVTVTDRVTDCSAFGDYLAVHGGATQAAESLSAATPVGLQPVDPRFQTTPTLLSSSALAVFDGLTPGTADLQETLLSQLAAVCPDL